MEDEFYILATDSSAEDPKRVLKHGETFAVFDLHGDIQATSVCQEGVYHDGTRFLSHLMLKVGPTRPFLLNSNVQQDNVLFVANLTNPDIYQAGKVIMPRGILHLTRTKMLWQATCYETLQFSNYGLSSIEVQFSIEYRCDFADLFEVRGMTRERKGLHENPSLGASQACFTYVGLDGVARRTRIDCSPAPDILSANGLTFSYCLEPKEQREFYLTYSCEIDNTAAHALDSSSSADGAQAELSNFQIPECRDQHFE